MMLQRCWTIVLVFACLCPVAVLGAKKDNLPTFVTVAEAGKDYAVQGEYVGKLDTGYGDEAWAAQVVALGKGEFMLLGLEGGLPGAGWERGDQTEVGEGKWDGDLVRFRGDQWEAKWTAQTITVSSVDGEVIGTLKKVERKSPTLGAKPPHDAVVLFDGKSAGQFENGKIVQKNLLLASCTSKRTFGDHHLHIEFRPPFKPEGRGQGRGNSGVYIQSRYEIQVLDSFGLDGKDNECGGIYKVVAPRVNMCLPPLTWQTYDVDFTAAKYEGGKKVKNARITVKHNGVVIIDDVELPHETPGRIQEGPQPAPLFLQGHGNPVVYRNIWVVEK